MFIKKFSLGNENIVSSKEKKSLVSKLSPALEFINDKKVELKVAKIAGSKGKIYFRHQNDEWVPILVDSNGKLDIFPTVFLLWDNPLLLPVIETWSGVSEAIINGADLMWPGICDGKAVTQWVRPGMWVSIKIHKNDAPIAVGKILQIPEDKENLKGKCVEVFHFYRDNLWELHQIIPNDGFGIDFVGSYGVENREQEEEKKNEENIQEELKNEENKKDAQENSEIEQRENNKSSIELENKEITQEEIKENFPQDEPQNPEECPKDEENPPKIVEETKEVVVSEDIVIQILLTALKVGIKDEHLPLEPSQLLIVMNQCKRDIPFSMPNSPFKKIGKLLKHANDIGLIEYKEPKGSDHKLVTSISRFHPLYVQCVPIVKKPKQNKNIEKLEEQSQYPIVTFTPVLIPHQKTSQFLLRNNIEAEVFTKQELSAAMQDYIKSHKLDENAPDKSQILLNEELATILGVPQGPFNKSELAKKFSEKFAEGYVEEEMSGMHLPIVKHGQIPCVEISEAKRNKRKRLTLAKGLENYRVDLKELCSNCQRHFSTQCSLLEGYPNTQSNYMIFQIQGSLCSELSSYLSNTYKIPKQFIKIKN
ncbi:unnamed protein product [Blepharisma stoltei]|uniref:SUI1 domain-containing protein n=1 Tax=Blepharisma stoltei TaxID=1481888 RepID=A0AAU9IGK3_9CILI|nr:unnamed protein product [Blepharisma stoltei]